MRLKLYLEKFCLDIMFKYIIFIIIKYILQWNPHKEIYDVRNCEP